MSAYQNITDSIVSILESGTVPWRQPWRQIGNNGKPRNARNIPYRGINVFILMVRKMTAGYSANHWITYKQSVAMGGNVKKGQKGTQITFWKPGQERIREDGTRRRDFILRYYTVFNIEQCENITLTPAMVEANNSTVEELPELPVLDDAEAIVATYFASDNAPTLYQDVHSQAYYIPSKDEIHIPAREEFLAADGMYYTLFHEMAHSTGHESRLNRKANGEFCKGSYGREELVAEMTNAFLLIEAGIDDKSEDNAAYIASWLTSLRADPMLVVQAAASAQKAADYILGITYNNSTTTDDEDAS